jgi:hypothetical protein
VAWSQLQPVRAEATEKGWTMAHLIFVIHFNGLLLWDLAGLFGDPHWKHSQVGGNRWRDVTRAVIDLPEAFATSSADAYEPLLREIRLMRHNTGLVGEKLADRDAHLDRTVQ